jgi:hypothetical protein
MSACSVSLEIARHKISTATSDMDAKEKVQRMEAGFLWFVAGFITACLVISHVS